MKVTADRWGYLTNLIGACLLERPERCAEIAADDLAPGPTRSLIALIRRRHEAGLAADDGALRRLAEVEELGATLVTDLVELPYMQAHLPRYVAETSDLAARDRLRRALDADADLDHLARILEGRTGPGVLAGVWEPMAITAGIDLGGAPPSPELLGLAYLGKLLLLSGAPEAAKTWLALAIIRAAVEAGGQALIIDTDGTGQRDIAERLIALGLEPGQLDRIAYSDNPVELFGTPQASERTAGWVAVAAGEGPVVVVIDSANPTITALGFKVDEAGVSEVEARMFAPLKRAGACVVLIDHVAIHAAKDSPYSIGSQRKHAAADVHLRMVAAGPALMRGGPPAPFLITGMKDRPGGLERRGTNRHVGKVTFTPGPDGAVSVEVDLSPPTPREQRAVWRPTVLMERLSRWAQLQPGTFSKRDADASVTGKGDGLRHAIDVLLSEGYLTADGGRYRHALPYRQEDDPEAQNGRDAQGGASPGASPPDPAMNGAAGASPRPAGPHAGSEGASHPQGRARLAAVGGGASPASPPLQGDAGRASGDDTPDWRAMLPEGVMP
ncbi:MAG: AAA family ATPase [Thermoleophilia bacterium]